MLESQIQKKIIDKLRKDGYYVIRLIKTNVTGIPDLLAMKGREFFFIEVKSLTGKLSEIQKYRIEELAKFGIKTYVTKGMDYGEL